MTTEAGEDPHLEIGHVLFMDIVGYSKLLVDEQSGCSQRLNQIVRNTEQLRIAEADGRLIRLPTGDGMVLVFFNSPEAPVRCAVEIAKALRESPQFGLRMGVHSGPVNKIADVNDGSNVAGGGINIAQRIMDCGDAGHILLSKRVAEDLEQHSRWRPHLQDLGRCEVKHGVQVDVFNLCTGEVGNPAVPEKLKRRGKSIAASLPTSLNSSRPRSCLSSPSAVCGSSCLAVRPCRWRWFSQAKVWPSCRSNLWSLPAGTKCSKPAWPIP